MKKITRPYLLKNKRYFDKRGFFPRTFLQKSFNTKSIFTALAFSKKNVIRGMHFQRKNKQTKIITVLSGKILDVSVNLRKNQKILVKFFIFTCQKENQFTFPITMPMVMSVYQKRFNFISFR